MRRECRERFPPPPISKETASWRSRHASRHVRDARAVMHVGIAHLRWRGKRSRHSRRMRTRKFTYLARGPWHKQAITLTNVYPAHRAIHTSSENNQCHGLHLAIYHHYNFMRYPLYLYHTQSFDTWQGWEELEKFYTFCLLVTTIFCLWIVRCSDDLVGFPQVLTVNLSQLNTRGPWRGVFLFQR